jgi:hypothetical protein
MSWMSSAFLLPFSLPGVRGGCYVANFSLAPLLITTRTQWYYCLVMLLQLWEILFLHVHWVMCVLRDCLMWPKTGFTCTMGSQGRRKRFALGTETESQGHFDHGRKGKWWSGKTWFGVGFRSKDAESDCEDTEVTIFIIRILSSGQTPGILLGRGSIPCLETKVQTSTFPATLEKIYSNNVTSVNALSSCWAMSWTQPNGAYVKQKCILYDTVSWVILVAWPSRMHTVREATQNWKGLSNKKLNFKL